MKWWTTARVGRFASMVIAGWLTGLATLVAVTWLSMPPTSSPELYVRFGHSDVVNALAWNIDGSILASASSDETVRLWHAKYGQLLRTLTGHVGPVYAVAWSADRSSLATGGKDTTVILWNPQTGKRLATLKGHSGAISAVSWSPDNRLLASGSTDGTIGLWDTSTHQLVSRLVGHSSTIYSLGWSRDGSKLASVSEDRTVKLWNLNDRTILRSRTAGTAGLAEHTLIGHADAVYCIAFSADGSSLISGSADNSIKVWNAATGQLVRTISGHSNPVFAVRWGPDGTTIESASSDRTIRVWDAATGRQLSAADVDSDLSASAWTLDGKTLATSRTDGTVTVWTTSNMRVTRTFTRAPAAGLSVTWSPDHSALATAGLEKSIRIWDIQGGFLLRQIGQHADAINSLAWSVDGTLASGSTDQTVRLWDPKTGKHLRALNGHSDAVYSIAWSPDGRQLASGSADATVKVWNKVNGRLFQTLKGHAGSIYAVAWSPDSSKIASGGADQLIRLWSAKTGGLLRTLAGHNGAVYSLSWTGEGGVLASGSGDRTIKLWNSTTGELLRTLESHSDLVHSVSLSADSRELVSASRDETIKVWDVPTGTMERNFRLPGVIAVASDPTSSRIAALLPGVIETMDELSSGRRLVLHSFESGAWLAYRSGGLRYTSSADGDAYAVVRFNQGLTSLYPLSRYRPQLRAEAIRNSDEPPAMIKPAFFYDFALNAERNRVLLGLFTFSWLGVVSVLSVRAGRRNPVIETKRFFSRSGEPNAEWAFWRNGEHVPVHSERRTVYVIYSSPAPTATELQNLRDESNIDPIPIPLARIERSIAERNCAQTLDEVKEPFLARKDPYDEGVPVKDETWFYGRKDLLERLPVALRQGQHSGIFGIRKVGKTSLINQIRDRLLRNTIAVALDCQGYVPNADELLSAILAELRRELVAQVGGPVPSFSGDFRTDLLALRSAWLLRRSPEVFVVILDEADKLFPDRRGIGSVDVLREAVRLFRVLRAAAQEHHAVALLLCSYRADLNRHNILAEAGENPLHMSLHETFLKFLTASEAAHMVREIGRWRDITWTDAALGRTFQWCAGHPLVTRLFASDVCDRGDRKHVDEDRVAAVARRITHEFRKHRIGIYFRESIWSILYGDEQECLRCIAAGTVIGSHLTEAQTNLQQFGLIDDYNQIQGDLLRQWINQL